MNQKDFNLIFDEKILNMLNIRELRVIGRKLCVPSPSSKNKSELINFILKIGRNEIDIPARKTIGRPSQNDFDFDSIVKKLKELSDNDKKLVKYIFDDKNYGLKKLANVSSVESYLNEPECNIYGVKLKIVCREDEKMFFEPLSALDNKDKIVIPENWISEYKIEENDIVELIEFESLTKIISLNGKKVNDGFDKLSVFGCKLGCGVKESFYTESIDEVKSEIAKITSDCEKNNIIPIIFSESEENKKTENIFSCSVNDKNETVFKKFMMYLKTCESFIFSGKNILAIIENRNFIENVFNNIDSDICSRVDNYLERVMELITGMGNAYISFGSRV